MDETSPGRDVSKPSVDELLEKFNKMQAYLPVLEKMIHMLKNRNGKPKQAQLEKILYVKSLIAEKKLTTVDSLRKCESLLRNYWRKFEDQLEEIPDMVFPRNEGQQLPLKKESLKQSSFSGETKEKVSENVVQAKKDECKVAQHTNSPDSKRDSALSHGPVSESRRKNKNPVQKLNHNDMLIDNPKSPMDRPLRNNSCSPSVYENMSSCSRNPDVLPCSHKAEGNDKYLEDDLRDAVERQKSKELNSGDSDHLGNRQSPHHSGNNAGQSSKYSELASLKYVSPDRKSSDSKKSDSGEGHRFSVEHIDSRRSYLPNCSLDSSRNDKKKEEISINNSGLLKDMEFDKKLNNLLSSAKKLSENTNLKKLLPNVSNKIEHVVDSHVKSGSDLDVSSSSSSNILGKMSEEELKRLVTENLSILPSLPPETKCILETIKQSSAKQASDSVLLSTDSDPSVRSDFENMHLVGNDTCQKIFQPSSRDPRRHSKDGQGDTNVGRNVLTTTSSSLENMNQPPLQSVHSVDIMGTHNFIPVITQMNNYSNRQGFVSHAGQIDNMVAMQPLMPIPSIVEQRNSSVLHNVQQVENVGGASEFVLPKSPVENQSARATLLPLPVPHFNNIGSKSSPRDPRRCIQELKTNTPEVGHQMSNMCVQNSVYQGDCRPQPAQMHNIQSLLSDPMLKRIDYHHGIQPPVPYPSDLTHTVRPYSSGNVNNSHLPMGSQRQVFHPSYTNVPAPRSMELSGYGRPNLHTVVPTNPPVFNNRPSVPKVQAPVFNRSTSSNKEDTQNARKKVLNSWLAIDPKNASKLPSQIAGKSKYSQNSCKFQRPLNNSFVNSQQKSGNKFVSEKRKQDEPKKRSSLDSNSTKLLTLDTKKSKDGDKDTSKRKSETNSQQKSSSVPNSPAPSKSLYGAIIVSKDEKGKDLPQKFRIPKIKKVETPEVVVDNSKNKSGKGEDVVHQMQLLFEKSIDSDEVKKKLMDAIRSTLGIEVKDCDSNESLSTESKCVDEGNDISKSEKGVCNKVLKTKKSTEKRLKKYVIISSDEDADGQAVLRTGSLETSIASERTSDKGNNDNKKKPSILISSEGSADEKTEKPLAVKSSKPVEGKKIGQKKSENKSSNLEVTKTVESSTVSVLQDSCKEKTKVCPNLDSVSGSVLPAIEDSKKVHKRVRSGSESSLVNEKGELCDPGNLLAYKKTKTSDNSSTETNVDKLSEEAKLQKQVKESSKPRKRASDVLEAVNSSDDLIVKQRKTSTGGKQICSEQSVAVNIISKPISNKVKPEKKKMKKLIRAVSDSSDDLDAVNNDTSKCVPLQEEIRALCSTVSNESSKVLDNSAEDSYDSSFSSQKKTIDRVSKDSVDSSDEETVGTLSSKKFKKRMFVKKKAKSIIIDDSSEDEALETKLLRRSKRGAKKCEKYDAGIVEVGSEKFCSKLKKALTEINTEVSDEKSSLPNSDGSNCEDKLVGSKIRRTKGKSKKIIVSESDDSFDDRFSDGCKRVRASSKKDGKENELSKFLRSQTFPENKDPKQNKRGAKRRNALEMLQDDIREMFIGNEVALAFGQRKCTVKSSERKGEEILELEERKKCFKKKHINARNDVRKSSLSTKHSSEESGTDDEPDKVPFWKDEKRHLKSKISSRLNDVQHYKDPYTCKNVKVLARRPCKEMGQGIDFPRQNIADSFCFCKKKPVKCFSLRIKLQDVLSRLWNRVFKLGMNLHMGSDATKAKGTEDSSNKKLENNKPDTTVSVENKSGKKTSPVLSESSADTSKAEEDGTLGQNMGMSTEVQALLPTSETTYENADLLVTNSMDHNTARLPLEEKVSELPDHPLQQDSSLKQMLHSIEPEKWRNICLENEIPDGNSSVTSNVLDECDDTVSNISVCDSDISEKGSENSLPEAERFKGKKHAANKTNLGKITRGKKKKKTSCWQNGVIKKSTKNKVNKYTSEMVNVCQDRPVSLPALVNDGKNASSVNRNLADPSYALDGRGKYNCKYCNFSGVKIVPHYKTVHPDKEVCVSRLSNVTAQKALSEAENELVSQEQSVEVDNSSNRRQKRTFICRICHQFSEYIYDFYCHITTHTGEYDFKCDSCLYSSSNLSSVKHHILLRHNEFSRTISLKRGPPHTAKVLYGYLCSACNFIQLLKENIESHIALRHEKETGVEILRINMSIPLEEHSKGSEVQCLLDTNGSVQGQVDCEETFTEPAKSAVEVSAGVDDTNAGEFDCENQLKRISSKNIPPSMNPVVVLKGMKNLIEKGATTTSKAVGLPAEQQQLHNEGETVEDMFVNESTVVEETENCSELEVAQNPISTTEVEKPQIRETAVNKVVVEEIVPKRIELNDDSGSSNLSKNESCSRETSVVAGEAMSATSDASVNRASCEAVDVPVAAGCREPQSDFHVVPAVVVESPELPKTGAFNADLQNADVESAGAQIADVQSADVQNADMQSADVQNADVQSTDVQNADVQNADPDVDMSVSNAEEEREAVDHLMNLAPSPQEQTWDKSPERPDAGLYRRSSLLERIEFLCAQSNATEKNAKVDCVKSKRIMGEHVERSTITTRAAMVARRQAVSIEEGVGSRVAVENNGALLGYSSDSLPVSLTELQSAERNDLQEDNVNKVATNTVSDPSPMKLTDHNYIKLASTSLGMVPIKQENVEPVESEAVASDANRLELYDVTSMPDPSVSSICIGPMEARREGERIVFYCRITGCSFKCTQAVIFACHYNNEHDKEWDGFCVLCGGIIDGIKPFCLEQAVEHLLAFHLTSKLKQKNRGNKVSMKLKSPSSTPQKANKVVGLSDRAISTTPTTTSSVVTATTFVTSVACSGSSVTTSFVTPKEASKTGDSCDDFVQSRAVTDLLKNAIVIKKEPYDTESETRSDSVPDQTTAPVPAPTAEVMGDRPRIRVRRISGDRLSLRTEESHEPPTPSPVTPVAADIVTKVERTDCEEVEQVAALDKNVSSDVSFGATSMLWPELSRAVCDESVLENSAGRCSPVLWGETGATESGDAFTSIRIESVVSLNPEANIQEDVEMEKVESVCSSPAALPPPKRLQADGVRTPPDTLSDASRKVSPGPKSKKVLTPTRPRALPSMPELASSAALAKSSGRVAVIKPLSKEAPSPPAEAVLKPPPHKVANTPRFVKNSKSPEAYRAMLEPSKLQRLYKCMHPTCVFATGLEERFVSHCRTHEKCGSGTGSRSKQQDWSRCAYCCKACTSIKELVEHISVEHGYCLYQCAYCFFRAMSPTYVLLHQRSSHVREAVAIIVDQRRRQMPELKDFPDKRENRHTVVLPYICAQGDCGARFYQCNDFLQHLKKEHSQLTIYSCHRCECKNIKPDTLLSHYKWHSLYQYQCMYCLHGADTAVDMKHHLCTFHSDQPNKAIIRIFQDAEHQSLRQVDDLLTVALDEGMDYANLFVHCPDDEVEDSIPHLGGRLSPTTSEGEDSSVPGPTSSAAAATSASKQKSKMKGGVPPVIIGLEGHDLFHCGNKGCIHTAATSSELKDHLSMCDFARESSMMECIHCKRKFKTITSLVDHLLSHGAERFCCSNCGFKSTMRGVVEKHCRQVHKFPATRMDPVYTGEVNLDTMWYVIRPREKRKVVKAPKVAEKKWFEPRDIHKLPDKDIFRDTVSCRMCSFTTKVRVNMVRHLEMHEAEKRSAGSAAVPSSCPVNPVPCLSRTEMMFDKMENLAASSQVATRLGADASSQPGFVPERYRYVCGVEGCRYMGCDEDMLRTHLGTLHAGETYVCAHCKHQVAEVTGVLEHLRMHGGKLYRCTYCAFFHYQVSQVEKHAAAKHPNQPIVPVTIRRVVD